ncbi:hypothetical protein GCM10023193_07920 [Planotetraspora kaengkrachanensis]|uniref:Uncharacterized protein n=1 Tax=Planotetraspora kaengkrachanensis TaxID=575193 RepID=A0A8J3PPK5_9ACTN|nr:hypothetical protein Pka01_08880 [Planotetraspora kaengkrachanensis]
MNEVRGLSQIRVRDFGVDGEPGDQSARFRFADVTALAENDDGESPHGFAARVRQSVRKPGGEYAFSAAPAALWRIACKRHLDAC